MSRLEDFQRSFLLIIIILISYLFITGKATPTPLPEEPIVIP